MKSYIKPVVEITGIANNKNIANVTLEGWSDENEISEDNITTRVVDFMSTSLF